MKSGQLYKQSGEFMYVEYLEKNYYQVVICWKGWYDIDHWVSTTLTLKDSIELSYLVTDIFCEEEYK